MNAETGQPCSDNLKNIQLKIRADKQLIADLDYCCKMTGQTKSAIIRAGIQLVKESIEKE